MRVTRAELAAADKAAAAKGQDLSEWVRDTLMRALLATAALVACLTATGCYKNAGPVIVDVRQAADGVHFVKCDLIVGRSLFGIGDDDLEHCVNERGKDVASPTPDQPHLAEMPNTTKGDSKP